MYSQLVTVPSDAWYHIPFKLSDIGDIPTDVLSPQHSHATLTLGEEQPPDSEEGDPWGTYDMPIPYLTAGPHAEAVFGEGVPIGASAYAARIKCPFDMGDLTFAVNKRLRGNIGVRLADLDNHPAIRKVTIEKTATYPTGWTPVADIYTDTNGMAWTAGLTQPLVDGVWWYRVSTLDKDDVKLYADVQTRDRNISWLTLVGQFPFVTAKECDLHIEPLTGIGHVAYIDASDNLKVVRTFDHGITFSGAQTVASGVASSPCVFHRGDPRWLWGLIWNEGTAVKRAWSSDGFANFEAATIMTGITHARTKIHPLTGIMMIVGWRDADDSIVAARSFDHGVTISTPVVVVAAPEQSFGLDVAPTQKLTWCITCVDADAVMKTYWSTDAGLHWSEAAA
jgi:hypothetical protein